MQIKTQVCSELLSLPCGEGRYGLDPPACGEPLILPHVGTPFEQQCCTGAAVLKLEKSGNALGNHKRIYAFMYLLHVRGRAI